MRPDLGLGARLGRDRILGEERGDFLGVGQDRFGRLDRVGAISGLSLDHFENGLERLAVGLHQVLALGHDGLGIVGPRRRDGCRHPSDQDQHTGAGNQIGHAHVIFP